MIKFNVIYTCEKVYEVEETLFCENQEEADEQAKFRADNGYLPTIREHHLVNKNTSVAAVTEVSDG